MGRHAATYAYGAVNWATGSEDSVKPTLTGTAPSIVRRQNLVDLKLPELRET